jgi:uncharacterized protein (DUF952 family)
MPKETTDIVHICPRQDWQAAQKNGLYRAESLEQIGFIHCSRPDQVVQVGNHYYRGQTGLVLLWIDPQKVRAEIRWESADGDTFPHIYGPLNIDAVYTVDDFPPSEGGTFQL